MLLLLRRLLSNILGAKAMSLLACPAPAASASPALRLCLAQLSFPFEILFCFALSLPLCILFSAPPYSLLSPLKVSSTFCQPSFFLYFLFLCHIVAFCFACCCLCCSLAKFACALAQKFSMFFRSAGGFFLTRLRLSTQQTSLARVWTTHPKKRKKEKQKKVTQLFCLFLFDLAQVD